MIDGSAEQFADAGEAARAGFHYLNPSLAASSRAVRGAHPRHARCCARFIVRSSNLVTDLAAQAQRPRRPGRQPRADDTRRSAGQRGALASAVTQLPPFMRRANTTFVNLRATLDTSTRSGQRVQARRQEAAAVPGRAAARSPATRRRRARPLRADPPPGRLQRPRRAHARRCPRWPRSRRAPSCRNGKKREGALPGRRPRRSRAARPSSPTRGPTPST